MAGDLPETVLSHLLRTGTLSQADVTWSVEELQRRGVAATAAAQLQLLIETGKLASSSLPAAPPSPKSGPSGSERPLLPQVLLQRFANWRLLGQGGMGVVYYAFDTVLERPVAVKLLRQAGENAGSLLQEARHQAHREHPHICPVFEVGEAEGTSYVVMHFIDGANLLDTSKELSQKQLLALFARIARTVHAAHEGGLVHGDLKPANILVERTPEGPHPWLVDFGLASALREAGPVLGGTPAYVAPELLIGERASPAADIFSLGATLYHLLAGRPPAAGSSLEVLAERARPTWAPPDLPAGAGDTELSAIVRKAMARRPEDRYPSALALAEDLECYLSGHPVSAAPNTTWYRASKWYFRHKFGVWLGLVVLLAVGGLLVTTVRTWLRTQQENALRAQLLARVVGLEERVRNVWTAPTHNIRDELDALQTELKAAAESARSKGLSEKAVHYLLGRAFFALENTAEAVEELSRAWDPAAPVPEVAQTYAQALVARYLEEASQLERLPHPEWQEEKARSLKQTYLEPAEKLLAQAQMAGHSGTLVRALLAAAQEDWAQTATHAQKAFAARPWDFNALLLAGEAESRLAWEGGEKGEWDGARDHCGKARSAFAAVTNLAPSHPRGYIGLAKTSFQAGVLTRGQGGDPRPNFQESLDYAQRALSLDPQLASAHVLAAFTLLHLGDYLVRHGEKMPPEVAAKIQGHVAAVASSPSYAGEGATYLGIALLLASLQEEPARARTLREQARGLFATAVKQDPNLPLAMNNLGLLSWQEGEEQFNAGVDPTSSLTVAASQFGKLAQQYPRYAAPARNLTAALYYLAYWQLLQGQDPRSHLQEGIRITENLLSQNSKDALSRNNLASLLLLSATWQQWKGETADPTLVRAWQSIAEPEVVEADPNAFVTRLQVATARVREALLHNQGNAEAVLQMKQQLNATLQRWSERWDARAAAADAVLLLALADARPAATSLVGGYEHLNAAARVYPRQAEVCRLQVAYATMLPATSPLSARAAQEAAACLAHWQSSAVFQQLDLLISGQLQAESSRPGLAREVALWRRHKAVQQPRSSLPTRSRS